MLFDLDGTLVDSNDQHVEAWLQVFAGRGRELEAAAVHQQIGKGADLLVPALWPGADEKMTEALGKIHGEVFKTDFLSGVKPFPSAHDLLLRSRNAGLRIMIASSASKAELVHYLRLLDAEGLVDTTTTIDDVETSKPAPDIFATVLKKGGVGAQNALAVGDSPYDVEAAGKCGVATVALRSGGFSDEALRRAGAQSLYDDAATLLADFDHSPLARLAEAQR